MNALSLLMLAVCPLVLATGATDPKEVLADDVDTKSVSRATVRGWTQDDCIDGRCDREVPVYGPNEKMTFTFSLRGFVGLDAAAHQFVWERTGDDGLKEQGRAPADRTLRLATSLDRPGFVRYYIELRDAADKVVLRSDKGERKVFFDGGAGVDILKIRQGVSEPADFDAFWAKSKATLAAVPWKGHEKLTKLDSRKPGYDLYAVEVPCAGGMPVTGFLTMPCDVKDGKKYPARIGFHGYGASWNQTEPPPPRRIPENWIAFDMSAHGFELMREKEYYADLRKKVSVNGCGYAFDPITNADPEKAYFRGMTYRVMRALEFLKSRPEWNGKDLLAQGGSMGGLQSIWAASLDSDVTHCNPDIPWCCDIGGETVGRNRGTWYVKWVPALGYYDPVNMVRRISPKCNFKIPRFGLGDYICPPTGVMAMYNNVPCRKQATGFQNSQHGYLMPSPHQMLRLTGDTVLD